MHARSHSTAVEAFLCIEQPRQRLSHWSAVLSPLDDHRAPPLAAINAYYDPSCDQALIGLTYDELALGSDRLSFVIEIALLAEVGMIQPAELTAGDRRRFLGERIARCSLHVGEQRTVVGALTELVRRVREVRAMPKRPAPPPPPPPRAPVAVGTDPSLRVANVVPRANSPRPVDIHRAPTVEVAAIDMQRMARVGSAEPHAASSAPAVIYARYLRSGRWVPVRLGAISLKGATLTANALPRLHDVVDVALVYGMHRALVRGPVQKVSTAEEAATSGAATFNVKFDLDDSSRRQLTTLLTAARAAKVTIKPPPPRHARRYPVEWPVSLGTLRGAITAEALDVSRDGMFVRAQHPLTPGTTLNFSATLDDSAGPISGRARVVRHVSESDAQRCGHAAGYGLLIVEMASSDRVRWNEFMTRIERRADKRVLIGASPGRFNELQSGLAALGYAVTGGTDPGALAQLASAEPRPVDAALIDAGWLTPATSSSYIETLFSSRNVPYVTMRGDVRRVRAAIDKLLSVV